MMALCDRCSSIPWSFFYKKTENGERDLKAEYDHQSSYSDLKSASEAGCQFCDLILFWANDLCQKLDDDACKTVEESGRVVFRQGGPMYSPASGTEPTIGFTVQVGTLEVDLDYIRVPESGLVCPLLRISAADIFPVKSLTLDHKAADSSLISSWVSECLENHDECRPEMGLPFVPTRVLEITEPNIRLVTNTAFRDRIKIEDFKYVALSYCWGNNMPANAKSLKDSIKQHEDGISFDTLPKTFQDAIVVARSLKISFIWIDSLCIVQDSLEDWQNEAAKMADIYSNAVLTLTASSSASVTQGFRLYENHKARDKTFYYCRQKTVLPSRERIYISPSVSMTGPKINYDQIINTRAWTFQERELSRRKLCFSANGISWECRRHKCDNTVPWGVAGPGSWKSLSVYDTHLDNRNKRRLWRDLVEEYSRRNLTKDSDRFPALSGVVKKVQELTNDEYLAGLWSSDGVTGLFWRALEGNHRRPTIWVAPSWSWASVIGEVQLDFVFDDKARKKEPKVLKMEVDLDSPDPFGSIKDATLTVSGKLKAAFAHGEPLEEYYDRGSSGSWSRRTGRRLVEFSYGLCVGIIRYDVEEEVRPGIVFCLRIMPLETNEGSPNWSIPDMLRETAKELGDARKDMSVGLAVVPTGRKYGEYRRIGLLDNILDAWLDDVSETEVRVV